MIKLLEHTRRPDISFNRNGTIQISARVARILSLRPGDTLNIALTGRECNPTEYLLFVIHNNNPNYRFEARCFRSKKGGGENYRAHSVRLCRSLLSSLSINSQQVAFMVGEPFVKNAVKYLPIITRNPI